jgi:cytochrome c2
MKKIILFGAALTCTITGLLSCNSSSQQGEQSGASPGNPLVEHGKAVFQTNCSSCHNLKNDIVGPSLNGVLARWDNDTVKLRAYIHNPAKMIEEKEPHALKAYERFKPTVMTPFPNLSDEDINAMIAYFQSNQ